MKFSVLATTLGAIALPGLAVAGALPPGSVSGSYNIEAHGSVAQGDFDPALTSQSVSATGGGSISIASLGVSRTGFRGLTVTGIDLGAQGEKFVGGSVSAQMSYQFMITGGGPGQSFVPVGIHERGGIEHSAFTPGEDFSDGFGSVGATLLSLVDDTGKEIHYAQTLANFTNDGGEGDSVIVVGGGTFVHDHLADKSDPFGPVSYSFDGVVALDDPSFNELKTNTLYTVNLTLDYGDSLGPLGDVASDHSVDFSAFMEASFAFAQGFDASPYRIQFSDGFGPDVVGTGPGGSGGPPGGGVGGVPEPATWSVLIMGFGAIGASLRRRRSHAARAAISQGRGPARRQFAG